MGSLVSWLFFLLGFLFLICLWLSFKLFSYKRRLFRKNTQVIQSFLDIKFFSKNLKNSLEIDNHNEYSQILIDKIKDYYSLEDIVIVKSLDVLSGENNTKLRSDILKYCKENISSITKYLDNYKVINFIVSLSDRSRYVVYVSKFEKDHGLNGFILCIEQYPALLTEIEIAGLENCINLLKTRLIYQ